MSKDDFQFRLDELGADLNATTATAVGAHWPSTAIACALLDKGLIEKSTLLKIVDTLILTASSLSMNAEADPDASIFILERFRRDLEQMNLKPGAVLHELELIELGSAMRAAQYRSLQDGEGPTDPDQPPRE